MGRIMAGDTWLWEKSDVFEEQWTESAKENGLSMLKLSFEDIIKDKESHIRKNANFVGLEIKRPIEYIIADTSVERTIQRLGFAVTLFSFKNQYFQILMKTRKKKTKSF